MTDTTAPSDGATPDLPRRDFVRLA
ncbi:MAG: hypothetical protein RL340_426, partial [Gemmatimonadota bacterium]